MLYQGIAARTFERSFQLADYVKVKGASLENDHRRDSPAVI
jgi:molecular chaperone IbpA